MTDLIDVLVADHRRIEILIAELVDDRAAEDDRRDTIDVLTAELIRHQTAEELYLCPAVRSHLPDGDLQADRALANNEKLERALDAGPTDLAGVITMVRAHIAEQESDLLPRLRHAGVADRLEDLGRRAEATRRIAPTRPHPNAPRTGPLNRLATPAAGLIDKVRDAVSHRPTEVDDL